MRLTGSLVAQVVVQPDGRVAHPRIVGEVPAPALVYHSLQSLRAWEFEPARRDGIPVPVLFNLKINFELRQ